MPLDFIDAAESFSTFSGATFNRTTDPTGATNDVGQIINDGSAPFQGVYLDLNRPIDLDFQKTITLRFYATDAVSHNIAIKLENGINSNVEVVQNVGATANQNWITTTFDFSNATVSGTSNTVNASGTYNRITLFVDLGLNVAGTYYVDDIDDGSTPVTVSPVDVIYTDLVWSDEFDTSGTNNPIDATKWFHQTQLPAGGNWFNGEQQHYTNRTDNSYVENGFLNIVAKRENFTDQGQTKQYTSARLNSKFAFTYGRVDVRAKLPFGDGTWPAIWMLGKNINEDGGYWDNTYGTTNWPLCGEIDIMEHGLGATNHVSSALHTACNGCSGNTMNFQSTTLQDVANNFHVYSVNWSPQQITFLIDDVPFYTYNPAVKDVNTYPFYEDQYMLLNIAMGGVAGVIDPNFIQSSMVIDYVRVYQNTLSYVDADSFDVMVYPNPSSNVVTISSTDTIDRIELYTMLGQRVFEKTENCNSLNVSKYDNGMYVLKIYSGNQMQTEQLVVSH
ncbi:MAG: family 16 glycosylhydrolase [Nonlabens sp.]|uniref:family 16 glycosylhydrolase n=1 Tax=Nonlabens sp. TaxID=1888209 RepID=UPI003EFA7180